MMLDHLGSERRGQEGRKIRLMDDLPLPPNAPSPALEEVASRRPRKAKRQKGDAKKPKALGSEGRDADQKKGHAKKLKATKRLAAELQGFGVTLAKLRGRLTDLHSVQLDHAELNASLNRRVEALDALGRAERGRVEGLVRQLDRLAEALGTLERRNDAGIATNPVLQDLVGRLARAESALGRLQDQVASGVAGPDNRFLGEVEGRLAALRYLLDAQGGRLDGLEREARLGLAARAPSEDMPWRAQIERLREGLEGRLQGAVEGMRQTGEASRRAEEETRSWAQARLSRLGRRQAVGLGLIGLLLVGVAAAGWWRTSDLVDGVSARLGTLEQGGGALAFPETPASHDLLSRLRRVESELSAQSRDLAATRQVAEGGRGHLADLAAGQQALVERLDGVRRELAEADKGLAVLMERVARLSQHESIAAAPSPLHADPPSLNGPRFAVQLVAYHRRGRVAPFVERHGIADLAGVTEIRVAGRPAYAVLLGPYDTEPEAARALGALPDELRALDPWVRVLPTGSQVEPWR